MDKKGGLVLSVIILVAIFVIGFVFGSQGGFGQGLSPPSISDKALVNAHECTRDRTCEVNNLKADALVGIKSFDNDYACINNKGEFFRSETPCHLGFEDFPGMLFDRKQANLIIVYGEDAPSSHIVAAIDIAGNYHNNLFGEPAQFSTYKDVDVFDPKGQNMILIGIPPQYEGNSSNQIMGLFEIPDIEQDQMLLKLTMSGDKYAIIVAAKTDANIINVATILQTNNTLEGTEIIF